MIPEKLIYAAVALNFLGQLFYIKSIIWGQTRPNLVTWFFWMLAPFIGFFYQVEAGATYSALPIFMSGFGPSIIILATIFSKNSYWKISKFDIYCGALAAISLLFYIFTRQFAFSLAISTIFAIASDLLAGIPTIIKSWKFPETESIAGYFWCVVDNIIGLLIIKNWSFTVSAFGIYFVILNTVLVVILKRVKIISAFSRISSQ